MKIPAGVDEGDRIRLSGEGEPGVNGGPPGDLYVQLHLKPHAIFQRDHDDLHCEMPIGFATAALGGEIEIPTLDGSANDQGSARDADRQGVPAARQGHQGRAQPAHGDLYCHVVVETPVNLTDRQRELLREFEAIRPPMRIPGLIVIAACFIHPAAGADHHAHPRRRKPGDVHPDVLRGGAAAAVRPGDRAPCTTSRSPLSNKAFSEILTKPCRRDRYWALAFGVRRQPLVGAPAPAAMKAGAAHIEKAKAAGAILSARRDFIAALDHYYKDWEKHFPPRPHACLRESDGAALPALSRRPQGPRCFTRSR